MPAHATTSYQHIACHFTFFSTEEQHQRVARVLLTIVEGVASVDDFFLQKADALGKTGATTLQRVTVVLRMLAYGVSAD